MTPTVMALTFGAMLLGYVVGLVVNWPFQRRFCPKCFHWSSVPCQWHCARCGRID